MNPQERNIRNKGMHKFRGVAHIAIGLLYIAVGTYFGYFKIFGTIELSNAVAYSVATLTALYGLFRIYRGWLYIRPGN